MKLRFFFYLALFLIGAVCAVNCSSDSEKAKTSGAIMEEEAAPAALNSDSLITAIGQLRTSLETAPVEPVMISTDSLRAKVRQKWSKMDFYTANGEVVRVKTYPHPGISSRTEEFYFDNGELVLVVVEDNGEGERGKAEEQVDKMYYFHKGELIEEMHHSEEAEYSIRKSDSEELLSEALEYLEIYAAKVAE